MQQLRHFIVSHVQSFAFTPNCEPFVIFTPFVSKKIAELFFYLLKIICHTEQIVLYFYFAIIVFKHLYTFVEFFF